MSDTKPKTLVTENSTPCMSRPIAIPNTQRARHTMMSTDSLTLLKCHSSTKNMIMIDMTRADTMRGPVSLSSSYCPPYSICMPSGSFRSLNCSMRLRVSVPSLYPRASSAIMVTVRRPLRWHIWPYCHEGTISANCRRGTLGRVCLELMRSMAASALDGMAAATPIGMSSSMISCWVAWSASSVFIFTLTS